MGAVSAALFGDYTRAFWLVLAIAVIGVAFAGIGYFLWCCTHALAMCCSLCRCCGRRARIRDEANPATLGTPEEAPPFGDLTAFGLRTMISTHPSRTWT